MSNDKERDAWIAAHGSERLRLALRMGLADKSVGVYRDERLAAELPGGGWVWVKESEISEAFNPSLAALHALDAAKGSLPAAELVKVRIQDEGWREAIAISLPWLAGRRAFRLVDGRNVTNERDP